MGKTSEKKTSGNQESKSTGSQGSNYLNRQHPNIEFTQELEENNSLPFLDILVTHVENGFTTNLYR